MNHSLRVAIAQPQMFWTAAENTRQIISSLQIAATREASICVFPELAVTGFHRQIKLEAKQETVHTALEAIRRSCSLFGIAAVVGTPTFDAHGNVFNSIEFIDANGETRATVEKSGITSVEATFFAKGESRPIVDLLGQRCTAMICREAHDVEAFKEQIDGNSVDLIFWPGIMRPDPEKPDQPEHHIRDAALVARQTGAFVIQSNWPMALNYPQESAESGHSVVLSPTGETMFRLPKARCGIGVFAIGDTRFDWIDA